MACIFMDGFDYYVGAATSGATFTGDLGKRWTFSTAGLTATVGPGFGRQPAGQGVSVFAGAATRYLGKTFGTNYTGEGIVGCAIYFPTAPVAQVILAVLDGTSEQITVRLNASSVLTINQGTTVHATGSTVLSSGVWYYIELKFTCHNSTGAVELHLNGAAEIASATNKDTTGTANNYWNGIGLVGSVATVYYDDVYVLNTAAGANTTYLGAIRCVALYPAAAGNYAQWAPNGGTNMGCASEAYEDGDSSFNQSSTANNIDTFIAQDLPASAGSVLAVQPIIVARRDAGAARTIAPLLRISGSDYPGATQSLTTSYLFLTEIMDLQPVGGTPAWDIATVNAMEAGYKLIS